MAHLFTNPKFQGFDNSGSPLVGGLLYTYAVGGTTKKATYPTHADAIAGSNANDNPVVLDGRGEAVVWGLGTYKFVLQDADATSQWTFDNIILGNEGDVGTAGSVVYLSDFDDIAAAVTAISSTEVTLVINEDDTMDENVTVPATTTLQFRKGNIITTTGYTLTIPHSGQIIAAPDQQIFAGSGTVAFTYRPTLHVGWFGARGDNGTTDNYTALNTITEIMNSSGGGEMLFQGGFYEKSAPLTLYEGTTIRGVGRMVSWIENSDANENIFNVTAADKRITIEDIGLRGQSGDTTNYAISIDTSSGAAQMVVNRVECQNVGRFFNAEDAMADLQITNVRISDMGGRGINIDSSAGNSLNVRLENVYMTSIPDAWPVYIANVRNFGMHSCSFDGAASMPGWFYASASNGVVSECQFETGTLELNEAALTFVGASLFDVQGCTFQSVTGPSGADYASLIEANNTSKVNVSACREVSSSGNMYSLKADDTAEVNEWGNAWESDFNYDSTSACKVFSFDNHRIERTATSVDLSGAAATLICFHSENRARILKATLLYTEASSAHAGVGIEIGHETDRNYYYDGTSEVSQSQWDSTDVTLLQRNIPAGNTVLFYSAGGKTGTGEIMLVIEYVVLTK